MKPTSFAPSTAPLWEPTVVLPSQFWELSGCARSPEMRLMAAILEDALQCITRNLGARRGRRGREFTEACQWFWGDGRDWPFAFMNVCDILGLDAAAVRQRLWRLVSAHVSNESPPIQSKILRFMTPPNHRRTVAQSVGSGAVPIETKEPVMTDEQGH